MALMQCNASKPNTISKYRLLLTETAETDLDEILSYISLKLCNPLAATTFFAHLQDKFTEVCLYPYSSPEIQNEFLNGASIRRKVVDAYLFYYVVQDTVKTVTILRVVYGPQNQKRVQKDLPR